MKVLMISDSSLMPTGFSKVSHAIASHLAKKYPLQGKNQKYTSGIFYQGMNSLHVPLKYCGYQLLAGGKWSRDPKQNWMAYYTRLYIKKIQPDVIFSLLDARSIGYLPDLLKDMRKKDEWQGKWIMYYPLDMEFEAPWHKKFLQEPDIVVCMSDFAYDIVKKWDIKKLKKIYHGYDSKIFFPREPDQEIIKGLKLDKYKHIIGYVSMNQFRKMTYRTVFAFKEVHKKLKDTCLLMHTPVNSPGIGWDITSLMDAFSIKDIVVNPLANFNLKVGVPDEYIARFFSTMDVHCLLSGGEGFSICTLEAMGCGIPQVSTDWTTFPQLLGKNGERGYLAKVKDIVVGLNVEYRAIADIKDAAKKLLILLTDNSIHDKMSKNASQYAKKHFAWQKIYPKWDKLFKLI